MESRRRSRFVQIAVSIAATLLPVTALLAEVSSSGRIASAATDRSIDLRDPDGKQVPTAPFYGRAFAVVIGIDSYRNLPSQEHLGYAVSDARALAKRLRTQYEFSQVIEIYDDAAVKEEIERVIGGPNPLSEQDVLFIYWAGHSFSRVSQGQDASYLIPHDGDFIAGPYRWRNIAIDPILEELRRNVVAKQILLIVDSCYPGSGFNPDLSNPVAGGTFRLTRATKRLPARRGLTVWTPCADQLVSDVRANGPSDFSKLFDARLGTAKDPLTIRELSNLMLRSGRGQDQAGTSASRSSWEAFSGAGNFVFVPKPPPAPPALDMYGHLQVNVNVDDAQVFVEDTLRGTATAKEPLNARTLVAGSHSVRVERDGYETLERVVRISPERWTQEQFILKRLQADLEPPSSPSPDHVVGDQGEGRMAGVQEPQSVPPESELDVAGSLETLSAPVEMVTPMAWATAVQYLKVRPDDPEIMELLQRLEAYARDPAPLQRVMESAQTRPTWTQTALTGSTPVPALAETVTQGSVRHAQIGERPSEAERHAEAPGATADGALRMVMPLVAPSPPEPATAATDRTTGSTQAGLEIESPASPSRTAPAPTLPASTTERESEPSDSGGR